MPKRITLYSRVNALFLTLLQSVPDLGTPANPVDVDFDLIAPPKLKGRKGRKEEDKMKWDDTADKNLLFFIIANQDVKVNYPAAAAKFGCTVSAVTQRICKLKKDAKDQGFGGGGASSNAGGLGSPAPTPPRRRQTKNKATAKENGVSHADHDGNGVAASPSSDEEAIDPTKAAYDRLRKAYIDGPPMKKQKGNSGFVANGTGRVNGKRILSSMEENEGSFSPNAATGESVIQVKCSPDVDENGTAGYGDYGMVDAEEDEVVIKHEGADVFLGANGGM
ncbi:MAG: hypothetical protein Q9220_002947 [cf. Caloplaca sp. 1 TL-2023]